MHIIMFYSYTHTHIEKKPIIVTRNSEKNNIKGKKNYCDGEHLNKPTDN